MNANYLDFEQPIAELEAKIEELKLVETDAEINISDEIQKLQDKSQELTRSVFKSLTAWQVTQLARHPKRPQAKDYIERIVTDYHELHGDRNYGNDQAVVGGIGRIDEIPVVIIGQQKGKSTKEKVKCNFGMMHPEGYRRAKRLLEMAEKFKMPVVTLIDTPGAFPGIEAEARGQSEAIARNLFVMSQLKTPIICAVIGEGCSGGALGIGVGDKVMMLQYSYYATISPEGCASILFKSSDKAPEAADIMGITADKLHAQGLIDQIVPEPLGGAHRNVDKMAANLKECISDQLMALSSIPIQELLELRYQRLVSVGRSE